VKTTAALLTWFLLLHGAPGQVPTVIGPLEGLAECRNLAAAMARSHNRRTLESMSLRRLNCVDSSDGSEHPAVAS
jgi:hypothetical protein